MEENEQIKTRDHRLYGGQTKNFTDVNGNNYPESFWIRGLVCDPFQKTLEIRNYGFESTEKFDLGAVPFTEKDSGVKNPVFRGTAFDRIIAANPQLVGACIMGMKQIQALICDFPSEDGQSMVSFFADAADVPFPAA